MPAPELRPYQGELVEKIRDAMRRSRRVLAVAPTGAGKTVTFSFIAHSANQKNRSIVLIAHRVEIVKQISVALEIFGIRHGRIWPGNTHTGDRVQVAMIQTLARRVSKMAEPDLIIVDEAHHAVAAQYEDVIKQWPNSKIIGVTATPERADGRGLGGAFDEIVFGPTMRYLIDSGYLAEYDYLAPPPVADFSGVKFKRGDYAVDQLAEIMDKATITGDVIRTYAEHLNGRPAIVFCVTIAHAEHVAEQFRAAGWKAASVDGTMDHAIRADLIASIGDGRLNVLTSCAIISEGTDIPTVAGAILLRRTKSLALYLQSVGRALRPKPDGSRAIIIDHVGNIHIPGHGMPCDDRNWSLDGRDKKPKSASITQCETCYRAFPANSANWRATAQCPNDPRGENRPAGCILTMPDRAPGADAIETVDGELQKITSVWDWAGDIDPIRASGPEFQALVAKADTMEKLKQIGKARRYHHGWAKHQWRLKNPPQPLEKIDGSQH